jgi:hypothetical protein
VEPFIWNARCSAHVAAKACATMQHMRNMLLLAWCSVAEVLAQSTSPAELEQAFQESMTRVFLQGQSTRDGRPGVSDDKYTIDKVVKGPAETWTFYVRVQYQGKDVTMPLPLQVKWAGDTPVITLTDQALPGLGTYTARVLLYQGRYAGTWRGKSSGGTVFGSIIKQQDTTK